MVIHQMMMEAAGTIETRQQPLVAKRERKGHESMHEGRLDGACAPCGFSGGRSGGPLGAAQGNPRRVPGRGHLRSRGCDQYHRTGSAPRGLGPITARTPYHKSALQKPQSGYRIRKTTYSSEGDIYTRGHHERNQDMKHAIRFLVLMAAAPAVFLLPARAMNQSGCERRCESILDSMTNPTQSGPLTRQYGRCMRACAQLGDAQDAYRDCIRHAQDSSSKARCRDAYRHNRPGDSPTW